VQARLKRKAQERERAGRREREDTERAERERAEAERRADKDAAKARKAAAASARKAASAAAMGVAPAPIAVSPAMVPQAQAAPESPAQCAQFVQRAQAQYQHVDYSGVPYVQMQQQQQPQYVPQASASAAQLQKQQQQQLEVLSRISSLLAQSSPHTHSSPQWHRSAPAPTYVHAAPTSHSPFLPQASSSPRHAGAAQQHSHPWHSGGGTSGQQNSFGSAFDLSAGGQATHMGRSGSSALSPLSPAALRNDAHMQQYGAALQVPSWAVRNARGSPTPLESDSLAEPSIWTPTGAAAAANATWQFDAGTGDGPAAAASAAPEHAAAATTGAELAGAPSNSTSLFAFGAPGADVFSRQRSGWAGAAAPAAHDAHLARGFHDSQVLANPAAASAPPLQRYSVDGAARAYLQHQQLQQQQQYADLAAQQGATYPDGNGHQADMAAQQVATYSESYGHQADLAGHQGATYPDDYGRQANLGHWEGQPGGEVSHFDQEAGSHFDHEAGLAASSMSHMLEGVRNQHTLNVNAAEFQVQRRPRWRSQDLGLPNDLME
jgi:hypothetical protein